MCISKEKLFSTGADTIGVEIFNLLVAMIFHVKITGNRRDRYLQKGQYQQVFFIKSIISPPFEMILKN